MKLPAFLRSLATKVFFPLQRIDDDIDEELRSHVEHRADDLERQGLPRVEAMRRARIEFGAYERVKEESHEVMGGQFRHTLSQDIRFSLRLLRKSPAFTVTAVLLLGLGIGATTAVFSLVNGVLLKPLPYPEAGMIVVPWNLPPPGVDVGGFDKLPWSPVQFHDMEHETKTYRYLGAFESASFNLTGVGDPALVEGLRVSWAFFPALGVSPALGRVFTREEDQPGHERVVLLSARLWRERFHADASIVGNAVDLNGEPYTVVGVMPPGFVFPRANEMPSVFNFPREAELWVPAAMPAVTPKFTPSELAMVGRLQPGVSVTQAQAAMDLFARRMDQQYPQAKGWFTSRVMPLQRQVAGDTRRPLLLMLSAVGVVLLIVCFNLASLLLTRAIGRQREFTVRAALGAKHSRILRQLLTESLILSFAGGILGVALAFAGVWFVRNFGPSTMPRLSEATPDLRVFAFVLGAALLTGVIIGLAPALGATRLNLIDSLKSGGQKSGAGASHPRLRSGLVVFQIALALVLVLASGLLIQTFYRLLGADPGFRTEHILTFELSLPVAQYPDQQRIAHFYQQAIPQLSAIPSVRSAAITEAVPMGEAPESTAIRIPGRAAAKMGQAPIVNYTIVSPGFFTTLGTPMERGRDFLDSDDENGQAVTVINRTMARQLWPHEDALGKQVVVPAQRRPMTIVGIVDDIRHSSPGEVPSPEMFVPYTQEVWPSMSIMQVVLRARGNPESVVGDARRALHSLDPGVPLAKITTLSALTETALSRQRFSMLLLGFFGGFSMLLAAIGIYGVVSCSVGQRTREIGIRMALGARRSSIFSETLTHGLRLAAWGIGSGALAALAVGRALARYLYGVGPYDPLTFLAVAMVLALVALIAGVLPARRAALIEPMESLRIE